MTKLRLVPTPPKPALFLDADGTIYRWQLVMDWLEKLAPRYQRIQQILQEAAFALTKYRNRQGPFMDYANIIIHQFWNERAYVGIQHRDAVNAAKAVAAENQHRTYVFTRELIYAAHQINWPVVVISGSPQEAVEEFMRFFNVTTSIGTQHSVGADGQYTAEPPHRNPAENKGLIIHAYAAEHNIDLKQSVAVGDSHGDIPMLDAVGYPLCFNPNTQLRDAAIKADWPIVVEARDQHYYFQGRELKHKGVGLPGHLGMCLRDRLTGMH